VPTLSGPAVPVTWDAGHPDAETLAAYIDRKLSSEARQTVESHASGCEECREVLGDTAALVESERGTVPAWPLSFRRWPVVTGVAGGLAAAAAVILLVSSGWFGGPTRTAEFAELTAAYATEPNRAVEGRLTGGFPYAPAPPVTRGGTGTELSPDVRIAVARIESAAADDRSVGALWALGVGHLASRNADAALPLLEEAARVDSGNAELQSDLSAAYLVRGRASGQRADLERALAAADRALTLRADLAEGLFNRALAQEALQRPGAAAAWRAVAAHDAGTPWAREANARLLSLAP
jgi:hypothetical protein